jgi:hypothetical protein
LKGKSEGGEMTDDRAKQLVIKSTAGVGIAIIVASLLLAMLACTLADAEYTKAKDVYTSTVVNVFYPIFNTLIATVLAFIFGKPIVESIVARIKGGGPSGGG